MATGDSTVFRFDVPALGYKVIRISARKKRRVEGDGRLTRTETDDPLVLSDGFPQSCRQEDRLHHQPHEQGGSETVAPGACGNQLQFFKDTPKEYDAWNIDPGTLD